MALGWRLGMQQTQLNYMGHMNPKTLLGALGSFAWGLMAIWSFGEAKITSRALRRPYAATSFAVPSAPYSAEY
ncbi:hypothetical protein HPP92_012797 [Vanilla planifolia]|uniref:Uncharacterized protein n=1 Tax=Vanilla planifolia TaxID=51239 RepID=A0A835QUF1_VANPL|nr:hypothetical protein HPP92_012797 [Vanilla planifolia]